MSAADEELAGTTLAQLIEAHGTESCGDPTCKVEAAREFVKKTKVSEDPWAEVLALHVHASLMDETLSDLRQSTNLFRRHFGLFIFELVKRLGGIVFTPSFEAINAQPGLLNIDGAEGGGYVIKIVPEPKAKKNKRLH